MLSLRQIRYFIGVAEAGQVSAAAKILNISQSAVTLAIKDLESALGLKLFTRSSTGLTLTRDGHRFLQHAGNIQGAVTDALASMQSGTAGLEGRIRLGLTYISSGYFIFPILARFRRAYPKLVIEVVEDDRETMEQRLKTGDVDLALVLTSNLTDRDRIASTTFLKSKRRLWLSSAHPLLSNERITFEDIAGEPYVLLRADEADASARKYWTAAGTTPTVAFHTGSLEAVRSMVANGFAVTILSDVVYRPWSLDGGRIETRDIDAEIPTMDLGLAWKRGRSLNEVEQTLRDHLIASVAA